MPQFILQEFKHPLGRPPQRIIFTKNEYCDKVKMPGWDRVKECDPKDNDPYNPPGGNQFLSTYNRIGYTKESKDHFLSTSKKVYDDIKYKDELVLEDDGTRYMPLRDTTRVKPLTCAVGSRCVADYLTTMQDSYRIPSTGVLKPLSLPKEPFLTSRKLKWEDGELDVNKYFDDCYTQKIKNLQQIKGFRNKSYDPITENYSDGTPYKSTKKKNFKLPFVHVK